ncbi:hypothetical protein LSTR_LSTR012782 [Laodelphax striatellus]|uniref:Chitin-binding type-2 domain-containing protein n=1 Tax=Laodelphax striatellus TaxID=195883 RepID=A0A482XBX5_LAOST|nr:hypothetical protein LSTR_LSTR012782 [Laodelphax striatellus]
MGARFGRFQTINRVLRNYPGPQPECRLSPAEDGDNAESAITEFPERNNEVEGVAQMEPKCVNGVMAHPGDCGKYYSCWNNGQSRTQLSCPAGLHFDSPENSLGAVYSREFQFGLPNSTLMI